MTTDHQPENWFHEAGSNHCPHGAEPDRNTDAWDTWAEHHSGSPQDVFICLEAPAGQCCGVCSEEFSEPVPWSACQIRRHSRPKDGVVPNPDAEHQQVTVWVGTTECLERECEEYFTDEGDTDPGVERCSHVREELACSCQRGDDCEYGSEPCPALVATT